MRTIKIYINDKTATIEVKTKLDLVYILSGEDDIKMRLTINTQELETNITLHDIEEDSFKLLIRGIFANLNS